MKRQERDGNPQSGVNSLCQTGEKGQKGPRRCYCSKRRRATLRASIAGTFPAGVLLPGRQLLFTPRAAFVAYLPCGAATVSLICTREETFPFCLLCLPETVAAGLLTMKRQERDGNPHVESETCAHNTKEGQTRPRWKRSGNRRRATPRASIAGIFPVDAPFPGRQLPLYPAPLSSPTGRAGCLLFPSFARGRKRSPFASCSVPAAMTAGLPTMKRQERDGNPQNGNGGSVALQGGGQTRPRRRH